MREPRSELTDIVRPVVEGMGYELVGVEYLNRGHTGGLLRIYIDTEGGVKLDDCAAVSHQLSGALDVEDPIGGHYDLEISSPGLDRPLFGAEQFTRFAGSRVRIKMRVKVGERRKFIGVLRGADDGNVVIEEDGEQLRLPFDQIESARLVPEF